MNARARSVEAPDGDGHGSLLSQRHGVLLLEDDPSQRRTLEEILVAEGLEVVSCASVGAALRHLARGRFAVAIVDQRLRGESGMQFLERSRDQTQRPRVIVNTAYGSFDSAREAVNLGAFAYVEKGGDPGELLRHVHRALRESLEEDLRAGEAWLEAAFDLTPAAISLKDREGRHRYVNRRFEEVFDIERERIRGKRLAELFPGQVSAELARQDAAVTDSGEAREFESRVGEGARARTLLMLAFPVRDASGSVVGVGAIGTDISDRKRVEEALARSERRYQVLYDEAPDIHLTIGAEDRVCSINRRGASHLGYRPRELDGRWLWDLVDEQDRLALRRLFGAVRAGGAEPEPEFRLLRRDGTALWVQPRVHRSADQDGDDGAQLLMVCRDVTRARGLAEELAYRASHDPLTGLVNRRELEIRIERVIETARRDHSEHALCFLDLDQFKLINDGCGHVAGDELLRQFGELMPTCVRKRDTLARVGGDEFAVLLERCSLAQARRVAATLRDTIDGYRFAWEGRRFRVGASVGIVPVGAASVDVGAVLRAADAACYAAKESGRNQIRVYRADDEELLRRHSEAGWVERLERALDENSLRLWAQPVVETGAEQSRPWLELLLRVPGEDGELFEPGAFLPAAERYRLLGRLDRWVVEAGVDWLTGEEGADIGLCSVNLSAQALADESFLGDVIRCFDRSGVDTERLCFELTETAVVSNLSSATRLMRALSAWGCRFALDDFGSGVSSFGYLKRLPVEFVKIDGHLVGGVAGDAIDRATVRAIRDIAAVMGRRTVAKAVASEAILTALRPIGVDFVQGFAIARPAPLASFAPGVDPGADDADRSQPRS